MKVKNPSFCSKASNKSPNAISYTSVGNGLQEALQLASDLGDLGCRHHGSPSAFEKSCSWSPPKGMCMCVCMYIYIYIYVYTIDTWCICIYTYTYTCMYIYIPYTCMPGQMCCLGQASALWDSRCRPSTPTADENCPHHRHHHHQTWDLKYALKVNVYKTR